MTPNVFKISVFETEENALQNVNPLEIIREGLELQDYTYDLFARIEYQETDACKGTCFSVLMSDCAKIKHEKLHMSTAMILNI